VVGLGRRANAELDRAGGSLERTCDGPSRSAHAGAAGWNSSARGIGREWCWSIRPPPGGCPLASLAAGVRTAHAGHRQDVKKRCRRSGIRQVPGKAARVSRELCAGSWPGGGHGPAAGVAGHQRRGQCGPPADSDVIWERLGWHRSRAARPAGELPSRRSLENDAAAAVRAQPRLFVALTPDGAALDAATRSLRHAHSHPARVPNQASRPGVRRSLRGVLATSDPQSARWRMCATASARRVAASPWLIGGRATCSSIDSYTGRANPTWDGEAAAGVSLPPEQGTSR